jgi:hypothetical protein
LRDNCSRTIRPELAAATIGVDDYGDGVTSIGIAPQRTHDGKALRRLYVAICRDSGSQILLPRATNDVDGKTVL